MARLEWTEKFRLDVEVVDSQHRHLVDLINQLDEALVAGNGEGVLEEIFGELEDYVAHHFSTEERLFENMGMEHLPAHRVEHGTFTQKVDTLRRNLLSTEETAHEVMEYLADWLTDHILEKDKNALDRLRAARKAAGEQG